MPPRLRGPNQRSKDRIRSPGLLLDAFRVNFTLRAGGCARMARPAQPEIALRIGPITSSAHRPEHVSAVSASPPGIRRRPSCPRSSAPRHANCTRTATSARRSSNSRCCCRKRAAAACTAPSPPSSAAKPEFSRGLPCGAVGVLASICFALRRRCRCPPPASSQPDGMPTFTSHASGSNSQ